MDPEVSGDTAGKLLARAAELDATGGTSARLSQLREAAGEAGISMTAFDRAAGELVTRPPQELPNAVETGGAVRARRSPLLIAAAAVLLLGTFMVLVVGFFLAAPAP
jgi:hypothetical protein